MNLSKTGVYFNIEGHRRNLKAFNPLTELNLEKYADVVHARTIERFKQLNECRNGKCRFKYPRELRQAVLAIPLRHEKIHQMKREEMGYRLKLDFVFVSQDARRWALSSTILIAPNDFPDTNKTSDHRPVRARFDLSQPEKVTREELLTRIESVQKELEVLRSLVEQLP